MSHRDRFIFVQALAKPMVEAMFRGEYIEDGMDKDIEKRISKWCKFLYGLAGELEPKENTEFTKIHPLTLQKYQKRALRYIEDDDSIGMVELRDAMSPGEWSYFHHSLYTEHSKKVKELCDLADELEEAG